MGPSAQTGAAADDVFGPFWEDQPALGEALLGRVVHVAKPQCVALVGQRRIGRGELDRGEHAQKQLAAESLDTLGADPVGPRHRAGGAPCPGPTMRPRKLEGSKPVECSGV